MFSTDVEGLRISRERFRFVSLPFVGSSRELCSPRLKNLDCEVERRESKIGQQEHPFPRNQSCFISMPKKHRPKKHQELLARKTDPSKEDAIPSNRAMLLQIYAAMKSMPWYCAFPTISEYMVENGWTKCFPRISDVGFLAYAFYLIIYLIIVEFGIYWVHRELHDIKPLYKYLHSAHHIYNKQNTLSPFAGLASQPIDGILQAVPHMVAMFLVPTHFRTHVGLIFLEAIWTANIHDCIHGKLWPIMGAGYHTIHHTTYRHNYGHYTIWMDWMFGTLRDPIEGSKVM